MFELIPCIIVVVFAKNSHKELEKMKKKKGNLSILYYCFIGGRKKEHGYLHQNGKIYQPNIIFYYMIVRVL